MKKEIAALLTLAFAFTSCEMEEKREIKHEEKVMKPNQDGTQTQTRTMEKTTETQKKTNGQY